MAECRGLALNASKASHSGSLLVDVLLAVVIFGAIVAAFSSGIFQGQQGTIRGGNRIRAAYLAEEALEAVRAVRDREGFSAVSSRTLDEDDGVQLSGSGAYWTIVDNPITVDGVFRRAVRFSAGAAGNERVVSATVTWPEQGSSESGSLTVGTYLTDWRSPPPPPPPDWSQPIIRGSVLYTANPVLEEATLEDVEVSGNYAFAADSGSAGHGLIIYNVADVTGPSYRSAVTVSPAYDIAIRGNYAYLATGDLTNGELKILDISNPLSVTCCAAEIDLNGEGIARGVSITGTGLYISRDASTGPELFVYDVGDSATAPTLLTSIESDPATRNMYAVTATGADIFLSSAQPYAYAATTYTTDELTVADVTAAFTGAGDAPGGTPQSGRSVAIFNTGAFLGVSGDSACEVFSFDIFEKVPNPNAAPTCGSGTSYDLGGSSDASDSANDMGMGKGISRLFIAAYAIRTGVRHFLHILDMSDVHNINSQDRKIYDGNITQGYETYKGLFYRGSDHTLFMTGGAEFSPGSDLLILQPTFTYN